MNMETKRFENNQVTISGEIVSNFEFSHDIYGEGFYTAHIKSERESSNFDVIKITVSERLADVNADWIGKFARISGQFRSYNKHVGEKTRLILYVFVMEFEVWEDDGTIKPIDENFIFLDGFICKNPTYRKTPLGREIADILIAVNRAYGKSDYIPCVAWGRNAKFSEGFEVGTRLKVWGRIQSREYCKKISDNEVENRIAYEVSISKMEETKDGQNKD